MGRTLYNYTWRKLPSRATPDTPPLAAAMLYYAVRSRMIPYDGAQTVQDEGSPNQGFLVLMQEADLGDL